MDRANRYTLRELDSLAIEDISELNYEQVEEQLSQAKRIHDGVFWVCLGFVLISSISSLVGFTLIPADLRIVLNMAVLGYFVWGLIATKRLRHRERLLTAIRTELQKSGRAGR